MMKKCCKVISLILSVCMVFTLLSVGFTAVGETDWESKITDGLAEINEDGKINSNDVLVLRNYIAGTSDINL